jgi:hypothetical protein
VKGLLSSFKEPSSQEREREREREKVRRKREWRAAGEPRQPVEKRKERGVV